MDFTNSKSYGTAQYPVHAEQTSGLLRRCEPPLTPEKLVSRYLKGVPLAFPNGDKFSPEDLKDKINLATNEVELLLGTTITREAFKEKHPFDWALYKSFIHIKSEHGPIISLEQMCIKSSNGLNLFSIPPEWIETANFAKNLINVIPLLAAFGANTVTGTPVAASGGAGAAFLAIWTAYGNAQQIPAYWEIHYTAGLANKEGQVPIPVNELIGVVAAMAILSEVAPTNLYNSQSLSQDGISQSSSGPGPMIYRTRMEELDKKKEDLIKKLKGVFSRRYFIGNI
jgi:hypothetical protein